MSAFGRGTITIALSRRTCGSLASIVGRAAPRAVVSTVTRQPPAARCRSRSAASVGARNTDGWASTSNRSAVATVRASRSSATRRSTRRDRRSKYAYSADASSTTSAVATVIRVATFMVRHSLPRAGDTASAAIVAPLPTSRWRPPDLHPRGPRLLGLPATETPGGFAGTNNHRYSSAAQSLATDPRRARTSDRSGRAAAGGGGRHLDGFGFGARALWLRHGFGALALEPDRGALAAAIAIGPVATGVGPAAIAVRAGSAAIAIGAGPVAVRAGAIAIASPRELGDGALLLALVLVSELGDVLVLRLALALELALLAPLVLHAPQPADHDLGDQLVVLHAGRLCDQHQIRVPRRQPGQRVD